jgi:hypothetical protein
MAEQPATNQVELSWRTMNNVPGTYNHVSFFIYRTAFQVERGNDSTLEKESRQSACRSQAHRAQSQSQPRHASHEGAPGATHAGNGYREERRALLRYSEDVHPSAERIPPREIRRSVRAHRHSCPVDGGDPTATVRRHRAGRVHAYRGVGTPWPRGHAVREWGLANDGALGRLRAAGPPARSDGAGHRGPCQARAGSGLSPSRRLRPYPQSHRPRRVSLRPTEPDADRHDRPWAA